MPSYDQSGAAGQQYQQYPTEQYPSGQQYGTQQQYAAPQTYAQPQYGPPKSNAGWAVAAIIFFWPVAFAAFNHLHDIYPKWAMGDHQGAQYASERVKKLGQIALLIAVIGWILLIAFYVIFLVAVVASVDNYNYN
ncbi:CD225/dispanin family protein [Rhodococcus sp. 24CO]